MSNYFMQGLVAFIGLLFLALGFEKRKTKKQKKDIEKKAEQLKGMAYRLKAIETTSKAKDEILEKQKENTEKKVEHEEKIKEAEATPDIEKKAEKQEEIINDIGNLFNSRNTAQ